jgi:hypothetical protein
VICNCDNGGISFDLVTGDQPGRRPLYNGADVGDLFMSLIHTCQLCDANSFDYLTELQRHAQEVASKPAEWMPWNYHETLERSVPLSDSA